jgi:hypothetical protein
MNEHRAGTTKQAAHHGSRDDHVPVARGEERSHSVADHASHLAHYAHMAHLAAEGLEYAAHTLRQGVQSVRGVQAAKKLLQAHGQMAYDLRRMRNALAALEHVATEGGARGTKARAALPRVRHAFAVAHAEFLKERIAVARASSIAQAARAAQGGSKAIIATKLSHAAADFESALGSSRMGRTLIKTGRIVTSETFVNGLVLLGAACEGVASYADLTTSPVAGKVAQAALGAASAALLMQHPAAVLVDLALPRGYKLSEVYHAGAGAVTVIGTGFLTHDTKPMDEFHQKSIQGSYGKVLQAVSKAGEYWSISGIRGGLGAFAAAVRWWVSH